MGKMQRTKGANGEREVVNLIKEAGFHAKRIAQMETNGVDKGDIELFEYELGSVKRGQHVPKFVYDGLGDTNYLFMKRDREPWLVTLPLSHFLSLMQTVLK